MGKYLVIEGLDGSGSSFTYENLIRDMNFLTLSEESYKRDDNYLDTKEWWKLSNKDIEKRMNFYYKRNLFQNQLVKENLNKGNLLQLKSLVTTLIVHGWFLGKTVEELLALYEIPLDYLKPDLTIAIFASNEVRIKRFEKRKLDNLLTLLDKITLENSYEKYWLKSVKELNEKGTLGKIIILNNDNSDVYENLIGVELKKLGIK